MVSVLTVRLCMNKHALSIIALLLLAIFTTLCTIAVQTTYRARIGNVCEVTEDNPNGFCYRDLPKAGFPLSFVIDSPSTSVIGAIGLEDDVLPGRFATNVLIHFGVISGLFFGGRHLSRRRCVKTR